MSFFYFRLNNSEPNQFTNYIRRIFFCRFYYFTELACQLNEMEEGVAPTDSRLRPDQRLMEEGRWDESNAIKIR